MIKAKGKTYAERHAARKATTAATQPINQPRRGVLAMNKVTFIKQVDMACKKVDPNPEHGEAAYRDAIELLIAMHIIAPGDKIAVCRDVVLDHMSGPAL